MKSLLLLCLICLVGCGTTANLLQDKPGFYGGVAFDYSTYQDYAKSDEASLSGDLLWTPYLIVDLPLSAVADTLTVPFVWLASTWAPTTPPPANWP